MQDEWPPSEIARTEWLADHALRGVVAIFVIGSSVWFGYGYAAAHYADDAAKWRQVEAAYQAEPNLGVEMLRQLANAE